MRQSFITTVFFLYVFSSCAGRPPFLEYTLARSAIKAAQAANSDKHAVAYWTKALKYYKNGEQRYESRDYISSKRFFNESVKWAEKAENLSRYKISSGEAL